MSKEQCENCDLDVIETDRLLTAITARFAYGMFIGVRPTGQHSEPTTHIEGWGDQIAVYGAVNMVRDDLRDLLTPTIETEED